MNFHEITFEISYSLIYSIYPKQLKEPKMKRIKSKQKTKSNKFQWAEKLIYGCMDIYSKFDSNL